VRIGWLYGNEMNIYGDRGNVIALAQRARWRGMETEVVTAGVGDTYHAGCYDVLFWGGGQDREQVRVAADLVGAKGAALRSDIEDGVPVLAVCGGYQLLGHYYRPHGGDDLPGIGALNIRSEAGHERFIGNIVVESIEFETLVGFENHSALTYLGDGVEPLGTLRVGHGNNGRDGSEGARYRNVVGCYMHGALLPKNPLLADWLLERALERRPELGKLTSLSDRLEQSAQASVVRRAVQLGY